MDTLNKKYANVFHVATFYQNKFKIVKAINSEVVFILCDSPMFDILPYHPLPPIFQDWGRWVEANKKGWVGWRGGGRRWNTTKNNNLSNTEHNMVISNTCYSTFNWRSSLSSRPAKMIRISVGSTPCLAAISCFNFNTFHWRSICTGMFVLELSRTKIATFWDLLAAIVNYQKHLPAVGKKEVCSKWRPVNSATEIRSCERDAHIRGCSIYKWLAKLLFPSFSQKKWTY